jgi:hypothetical protein
MRHTPELRFHWDTGVDHALRIETLLEEIRREDAPAVAPPEPPRRAAKRSRS